MLNSSSLLLLACAWPAMWLLKSVINSRRGNPGNLPFPPGPKGKPIIGNAQDIPAKHPWLTYLQWSKKYNSDVVHACVLRQHIIIINSLKAANDLFEKRSRIYADRPRATMIDLMDWDFTLGLMPLGDRMRRQRRFLHQNLRKEIAHKHQPTQAIKVHDMLRGFLTEPEDFLGHIKTLAAAVVMAVFYGYDISPVNDKFVTLSERAVGNLSNSIFPGATAVNWIPILRFLPSWFPGAGFQKYAEETRDLLASMRELPFQFVRESTAAGLQQPSIVAKYLEGHPDADPEEDAIIKDGSATGYAAGADTTVAAIATFILAMAIHPATQKRAQDELQTVIGARLPTIEDRNQLPYIEAIYRECFRWRPVLPLSLPHSTYMDDIYNGYYIPRGAVIMTNIWAMSHDESTYKDPESFSPERFLDDQGQLNEDEPIVWGFGRRGCVGKHLASHTVWLAIASVLTSFDVRKAKDSAGNEIPIPGEYSSALICHPHPFRCSITPRSSEARKLIQATKAI
ncbi:CyP450 monooxygenase [Infundibulicybe gibba]|nr:CyP450 monooxygenase [Infundibulicybe gibba]